MRGKSATFFPYGVRDFFREDKVRLLDVHICKFCKHRPDEDGFSSTYDWNGCNFAASILYDESLRTEYGKTDNDRKVYEGRKLVMQTIDNGGGYNIVRCPAFWLEYGKYINSEEWKEKRIERIELDGYKCRFCGSAKNLEVHHINYSSAPNEDMDDLLTLCHSCHQTLHAADKKF